MSSDYQDRLDELAGPDAAALLAGLDLPEGVPIDVLVADYPWLGPLLEAGRDLPLQTVPRSLSVRLRALIHTHESMDEPEAAARPRPQVARLHSDSRKQRELVGVRGGNVDNWTMMFRSALADVVIGVSAIAEGSVRLSGQVLVHDGDARQFRAELSSDSAASSLHMTDSGDAFGRFTFAPVPAEPLQLVLSDGLTDIVAAVDLEPGDLWPEGS